MSITSIALTSLGVTITRSDGSPLSENGVIASGNFGISGGFPYFDTNSASVGDGAGLGYDGGTGNFFLHSGPSDAGAVHLMGEELRRAARLPVTLVLSNDAHESRRGERDRVVLPAPNYGEQTRRQAREGELAPVPDATGDNLRREARRRAWLSQV